MGDIRIWEDNLIPALYLAKLATGAQVRGQDYFCNTMLHAIIDFAGSDTVLRLDCLSENTTLQKYYNKLGFVGLGKVSFFSEKQQQIIKVERFERSA